jgi:hypothetical protein
MSEYYVGYQPCAPPGIRRHLRAAVTAVFLLGVAGAALFAASQHNFARSYFDFGKPHQFSGTLSTQPFPTLLPDASSDHQEQAAPYLLVAPGKFGAVPSLTGRDAKNIRLRGTLIHRDEGRMIEVDPSSIEETGGSPSAAPRQTQELGEMTLAGEIVDTKCFLGVMNPGEGKVHRDCAARCLSGGIPPALVTTDLDGSSRLVLLLGDDGKPLPKESFLQRVGQPVSVEGRVTKSQGLFYLRTSATGIVPLP